MRKLPPKDITLTELRRDYENLIPADYFGVIKLECGEIIDPITFLTLINGWFVAYTKKGKKVREFKFKHYRHIVHENAVAHRWNIPIEEIEENYAVRRDKYGFNSN